MKTIIIDLPDNLSATKVADALGLIRRDIRFGSITLTPPFHYNLDTSVGPVTVRSEAEPDNQAHPPLNTPLSAFTPAMLDALPVGSAFSRSDCLPIVRCETGWRDEGSGNTPKTVWTSEEVSRCFHSRTLTRVGPEQASEPALTPCGQVPRFTGQCPKHGDRCPTPSATLPDPWPNMLVEVQADSADEWDRGAIRRAYRARHGTLYVHVEGLENPVQWHPDEIREVRTPDGVTLWKRPAANGGAR